MDKEKIKNWWSNNKMYLLIGIVVLIAFGFFRARSVKKTPPDYEFAIISAEPMTNDELEMVESALYAVAEDTNGDSKLMIELHSYWVDLSEDGKSTRALEKLQADLDSKQSGVIILDQPAAFESRWQNVLSEEFAPFGKDMYIYSRQDSHESCRRMVGFFS